MAEQGRAGSPPNCKSPSYSLSPTTKEILSGMTPLPALLGRPPELNLWRLPSPEPAQALPAFLQVSLA